MTLKEQFEEARKLYPGTKKGHDREYNNFFKRSTKPAPSGIKFVPAKVIPLLKPAIEYQIRYRKWCKDNCQWVAPWKNFQTWINKGCWEDEYPEFPDTPVVGISNEQKAANKAARESLKRNL